MLQLHIWSDDTHGPSWESLQLRVFSYRDALRVGFGTAAAAHPQSWWRSLFNFPILSNAFDYASTPVKAAAGSLPLTMLLRIHPMESYFDLGSHSRLITTASEDAQL